MARLKSAWPAAAISWLVNPEWAPVLAGNPDLHEVVLFPRQEFSGWAGLGRLYPWFRAQVRGRRPELALDFQGLLRSALIGRLSGPARFLGLADAREGAAFLYTHAVPPPVGRVHAVERYLALADDALGRPSDAPAEPLHFRLPAGEPVAVAGLQPDFILLHPFARGTAKSFTPAQVPAFCERLAPRQVVLVGRHPQPQIPALPGVINLFNQTTLPQLIWLLRRAAFVISVDSGPMHLAAALGRPLVAIHTWSDPLRVGPYRPDAWVWKNGQLRQVGEITASGTTSFPDDGHGDQPLTAAQIHSICALATSPSYSCA